MRQEFRVTVDTSVVGRSYVVVTDGDRVVLQGETACFASDAELRAAIGRGVAASVRIPSEHARAAPEPPR